MATWKVKVSYGSEILYDGSLEEVAWNKSLLTSGKLLTDNINVQYYKSSPLPSAYQQVEYLQATGTQYIISDVNMSTYTSNFAVDYTAAYTSNDSQSIMCGWYYGSGNNYFIVSNDKGKHKFEFASSSYYPQGTSTHINLNQKYYIYYKPATRECKVDSNSYQQTSDLRTVSYRSCNIPIFAYDTESAGIDYFSYAKLYHMRFYNSTTIIRNYYPCYRKSDSVAGLYDLVNNVFYTNSGTGTFTVGPDYEEEL